MALNRDLAALAALGMLGFALRGKDKKQEKGGEATPASTPAFTTAPQSSPDIIDDTYDPNVRYGSVMDLQEPGWESKTAPARTPSTAARSVAPRATPAPIRDTGDETERLARRYPAPAQRAQPNMMSLEEMAKLRAAGGSYGRTKDQAAQDRYAAAQEYAASPQGRAERQQQIQSQALERVTPEETLIGGPGIKTIGAAAKALANRGAKSLPVYMQPAIGVSERAAERVVPQLQAPQKRLTGPSKADLLARDRAERAVAKEAERQQFNQRGVDRFIESTFEGGMKRGGKVKAKPVKKMASGGMARSSASKRADGIATKGKTRGKIY